MKKIKSTLLIIFIFVIVSFFALFTNRLMIEASGESAFTAYAYELRLVKYEKKGDSKEYLGSPILVYHPDLFLDVIDYQINTGEPLPSSYDDFYNRSYDIHDFWSTINLSPAGLNYYEGNTYSVHEGRVPRNITTVSGGTYHFGYIGYPTVGGFEKQRSTSPLSGTAPTDEKYYQYTTNAARASYYGAEVDISKYYKIFKDDNLTKDNIENNGYLNTVLQIYGGTLDKIRKNFNYPAANDMEIHKYYIEAVPVHRVPEKDINKLTYVDYYNVGSYGKVERTPESWGSGDWREDGTACDCPSGYDCDSNCNYSYSYSYCNCPSNMSCDSSCNSSYTISWADPPAAGSNCVCKGKCIDGEAWPEYGYYECYVNYTVSGTESGSGTISTLYTLKNGKAMSNGLKVIHTLYGKRYRGPSYLKTAQETGENLNRAVNSCDYENSKHCILNEAGGCTGVYEYYIGPNKEDALVGIESHNPHKLSGSCSSSSVSEGVQHAYFPHLIPIDGQCENGSCCKTEACSSILSKYGNTSDEYLMCAENYCEAEIDYDTKGNPRNRKKECLLDACGYSYGVSPTNPSNPNAPDRESRNSCNNTVSPYTSNPVKLESTCNVIGSTLLKTKVGTKVEKCDGDKVTDFNDPGYKYDDNDTRFEKRTYINKICKEDVSFETKNTSIVKLTMAGTGFDYPITEYGNRTCQYFINLEQWKFDYASAPARDPILRKRMLYILDIYNSENKPEKNMENYVSGFSVYDGDEENFGRTNYEQEGFDFSKSNVDVEIEEKLVDDKIATPTKQNMIITRAENISEGVDPTGKTIAAYQTLDTKGLKTNVSMSTITNPGDLVTIIENRTKSTKKVERYETDAKGILTYELEKVCVKTDGSGEVYKAPENGICEKSVVGNILAENKHYTSFNIKLNNENQIKTSLSVGKDSDKFYEADEKCTYGVYDNQNTCQIEIEGTDGTAISEKEIFANKATVRIRHRIASTSITESIYDTVSNIYGATTPVSKKIDGNTADIIRDTRRAEEVHEIIGEVKYLDSNGNAKTINCEKKIVLKTKEPSCVSCEIVKNSENNYEIKTTGTPNYYSYYISPSVDYDIYYKYRKIITTSIIKLGVAYVALDEPLEEGEKLVAVVRNDSCGEALCEIGEDKVSKKNCSTLFASADVEKIKKYCETSWENDINSYKSSDDCFDRCSTYRRCEYYGCDKTKAENFCDSKWSSYEYSSKNQCMNECYVDCSTETSSKYLFRPINVLNPFPNSQESIYPYEKGNRVVGQNWSQLSDYITSDDDDETSVTGANANNNKVEYIIDLTPSDIRRIRQDTSSISNGINDAKRTRAVYAKLDRIQMSSNVIEEYKSKFLHKSQFTELFKSNHGNVLSTFNP